MIASPYPINKKTQVGEFSTVNPEQSKFIKPVKMVISTMVLEGNPDSTTYLKELLRTN